VNRFFRSALFPLVIIAALIWLGAQTLTGNSSGSSESLRFSDALALVRQNPGGIDHVTFHPSTQEADFRLVTGRTRTTVYPTDQSGYELQQLLEEKGIAFEAKRKGSSPWWSFLTALLPFVLLFGFWVFLTRMVKQQTPTAQDPPETRSPY
jgi:cell division protease FtsH